MLSEFTYSLEFLNLLNVLLESAYTELRDFCFVATIQTIVDTNFAYKYQVMIH